MSNLGVLKFFVNINLQEKAATTTATGWIHDINITFVIAIINIVSIIIITIIYTN